MPLKDVSARKEYDRKRGNRQTEEYKSAYEQLPSTRVARRNAREILKLEVLGHYGVHGVARCTWPGCDIHDQDMLTLDHIHGGGTEHRKSGGCNAGVILYRKLRHQDYPNGYQTLCFNHQWKKQMSVLRKDFNMRNGLDIDA